MQSRKPSMKDLVCMIQSEEEEERERLEAEQQRKLVERRQARKRELQARLQSSFMHLFKGLRETRVVEHFAELREEMKLSWRQEDPARITLLLRLSEGLSSREITLPPQDELQALSKPDSLLDQVLDDIVDKTVSRDWTSELPRKRTEVTSLGCALRWDYRYSRGGYDVDSHSEWNEVKVEVRQQRRTVELVIGKASLSQAAWRADDIRRRMAEGFVHPRRVKV